MSVFSDAVDQHSVKFSCTQGSYRVGLSNYLSKGVGKCFTMSYKIECKRGFPLPFTRVLRHCVRVGSGLRADNKQS